MKRLVLNGAVSVLCALALPSVAWAGGSTAGLTIGAKAYETAEEAEADVTDVVTDRSRADLADLLGNVLENIRSGDFTMSEEQDEIAWITIENPTSRNVALFELSLTASGGDTRGQAFSFQSPGSGGDGVGGGGNSLVSMSDVLAQVRTSTGQTAADFNWNHDLSNDPGLGPAFGRAGFNLGAASGPDAATSAATGAMKSGQNSAAQGFQFGTSR